MIEELFLNFLDVLLLELLLISESLLLVQNLVLVWLLGTSLLLHDIKILLSLELTVEDLGHDVLLLGGGLVEWLAQLHDADGTFGVTDGGQVLVHRDGGKWNITNLLTVSNLVLAVIEIPHIEESINSGEEEESAPSLGPATVCQVS